MHISRKRKVIWRKGPITRWSEGHDISVNPGRHFTGHRLERRSARRKGCSVTARFNGTVLVDLRRCRTRSGVLGDKLVTQGKGATASSCVPRPSRVVNLSDSLFFSVVRMHRDWSHKERALPHPPVYKGLPEVSSCPIASSFRSCGCTAIRSLCMNVFCYVLDASFAA